MTTASAPQDLVEGLRASERLRTVFFDVSVAEAAMRCQYCTLMSRPPVVVKVRGTDVKSLREEAESGD